MSSTDLDAQGDSLQLHTRLVEPLDVLPRPGEIFGLHLGGVQLPFLGVLLDAALQGVLLALELLLLSVQLAHGLLEGTLVLSQLLLRRHALAEGPFYDLLLLARQPSSASL